MSFTVMSSIVHDFYRPMTIPWSHEKLGYVNDLIRLPKMPAGSGKSQISTILDNDIKELLQQYADDHHWSVSKAAAILIQEGLKLYQSKSSQKTKSKK